MLSSRDLELWSKLKLGFLDSAYSSLYSAVSRHYEKYNVIPSFEELELSSREGTVQKTLAAVRLIDEPDISAEVALEALIDQYTQNETIAQLEKFVDKLPIYDSEEIKENLASIVLHLDSKTQTTEGVYAMNDIMLFKSTEDLSRDRVHLGLNNTFDSVLGGVARQELILIGGQRGAGKSITCSNILANQYEAGFAGVYFTIEMRAHEVLERNLSILAGVPYMALKHGTLSNGDMLKVIRARAGMFSDANDLVEEFTKTNDRFKFEATLVKEKTLKPDNQMIIIDDRALTLTSIDLHIGKLKARFGDNLKLVVIDYLNKVVVEGNNDKDHFDWKQQIIVSTKFKDLGRKHDVVVVSPYQIDATGEARFAKGILDAADIALLMNPHSKEDNAISFDTTKIRGGPPMKFTSPINWDSLRISSTPIETPHKVEKEKKPNKHKTTEGASDAPW